MKRNLSVSSVLRILSVSTSGYYSWISRKPSKREKKKTVLKRKIAEIYNESKQIYGAPKITAILKAKGCTVAEKTVGNYMREEGIKAIWVRPYVRTTIDPDFNLKLKNILDRSFNPKAANTVWVTDITYIHTLTGFAYLTSVMDLFSRKIIGWHLSDRLSTEGVLVAINKAKSTEVLKKMNCINIWII